VTVVALMLHERLLLFMVESGLCGMRVLVFASGFVLMVIVVVMFSMVE
jgi:hypothetical protein